MNHHVSSLRLVLIALATLPVLAGATERSRTKGDSTLLEYVQHDLLARHALPGGRASVVIMFDFLRFGCVPCLTEFLTLCDTLKEAGPSLGNVNVLFLIRRNDLPAKEQLREMKSWLHSSGEDFPFYLAPASIFNRFGIDEVSVMIVNGRGEYEFFGRLPRSSADRGEILRLIQRINGR